MSGWKRRRRDLIDAQRNILDEHDRDPDRHAMECALERAVIGQPWWVRYGTLAAALCEHAQAVHR